MIIEPSNLPNITGQQQPQITDVNFAITASNLTALRCPDINKLQSVFHEFAFGKARVSGVNRSRTYLTY
ncbi:hypothetical protein CEXT_384981 [Caerostris extrusa]|uniref:Uncharacterized protein n=1 Tax=Caerostris extrusa TaxID=172846 RepID=A0AAV4M6H4_CAEEX|nr:hypothetical protein CEXT_384981 [Caerostris extrusa]